jgi:hypothetical protein
MSHKIFASYPFAEGHRQPGRHNAVTEVTSVDGVPDLASGWSKSSGSAARSFLGVLDVQHPAGHLVAITGGWVPDFS